MVGGMTRRVPWCDRVPAGQMCALLTMRFNIPLAAGHSWKKCSDSAGQTCTVTTKIAFFINSCIMSKKDRAAGCQVGALFRERKIISQHVAHWRKKTDHQLASCAQSPGPRSTKRYVSLNKTDINIFLSNPQIWTSIIEISKCLSL